MLYEGKMLSPKSKKICAFIAVIVIILINLGVKLNSTFAVGYYHYDDLTKILHIMQQNILIRPIYIRLESQWKVGNYGY